jgi:AcrR family transcriptional regulator
MIRLRKQLIATTPLRDRSRDKILDAASTLFAQHGFAGTSIDQVIADCGIGRDTFYRRFASKLELFEAVVLREREQTDARFAAFIAATDGAALERLEAAARWLLEVNLEPGMIAMKRIVFSEARVFGRAVQDAPSPIVDHLIDLIDRLQREGVFQAGDAGEIVGFIINSLILGPMMQAMLASPAFDTAEAREAYFRKVWPRIIGGLCSCISPNDQADTGTSGADR